MIRPSRSALAFLFIFLLATLLAAAPAFSVAVDETPLADPRAEAEAREIMKGIRCLVCQNQSIEDSNADLAKDLRQIVRERVAAGDGEKEVQDFLRARYGDWILLKPPFRTRTLPLWIGPFVILALGATGLFIANRRRAADGGPEGLSDEEQQLLDVIEGEDEG
ncbi:MAG: cytochrome c-type biogenesis protein CcmH [Proteobacteria bacterium]|nr:cytochrome c-type biogenesis protein CcmH [Pseudomonadota bacterium]